MLYHCMYSCRHEAIAEYFEDPKPNCGKSCDFCKSPREVKEAARDMKLCQKGGGRVGGGGMGVFERGEPDSSLYGGGRWGYKRYIWDDTFLLDYTLSYCTKILLATEIEKWGGGGGGGQFCDSWLSLFF